MLYLQLEEDWIVLQGLLQVEETSYKMGFGKPDYSSLFKKGLEGSYWFAQVLGYMPYPEGWVVGKRVRKKGVPYDTPLTIVKSITLSYY